MMWDFWFIMFATIKLHKYEEKIVEWDQKYLLLALNSLDYPKL